MFMVIESFCIMDGCNSKIGLTGLLVPSKAFNLVGEFWVCFSNSTLEAKIGILHHANVFFLVSWLTF